MDYNDFFFQTEFQHFSRPLDVTGRAPASPVICSVSTSWSSTGAPNSSLRVHSMAGGFVFFFVKKKRFLIGEWPIENLRGRCTELHNLYRNHSITNFGLIWNWDRLLSFPTSSVLSAGKKKMSERPPAKEITEEKKYTTSKAEGRNKKKKREKKKLNSNQLESFPAQVSWTRRRRDAVDARLRWFCIFTD